VLSLLHHRELMLEDCLKVVSHGVMVFMASELLSPSSCPSSILLLLLLRFWCQKDVEFLQGDCQGRGRVAGRSS